MDIITIDIKWSGLPYIKAGIRITVPERSMEQPAAYKIDKIIQRHPRSIFCKELWMLLY